MSAPSKKAKPKSQSDKPSPRDTSRASATSKSSSREASHLCQRSDKRTERRFAPSGGSAALASTLLASGGAIAIGAGVFGQFLRSAGPHPMALPLLGGGVLGLAIGTLLGRKVPATIRVGDAGIGVETADGIDRLAWHAVERVSLERGVLTFSGDGRTIAIAVAEQPAAASLALVEARDRIPGVAASVTDDLPAPAPAAGEALTLEPPQLAGLRCRASDRLLSFENEARLCGRCGATYHREEIPVRCACCDALLRAS
jgi:hypothetical protein